MKVFPKFRNYEYVGHWNSIINRIKIFLLYCPNFFQNKICQDVFHAFRYNYSMIQGLDEYFSLYVCGFFVWTQHLYQFLLPLLPLRLHLSLSLQFLVYVIIKQFSNLHLPYIMIFFFDKWLRLIYEIIGFFSLYVGLPTISLIIDNYGY